MPTPHLLCTLLCGIFLVTSNADSDTGPYTGALPSGRTVRQNDQAAVQECKFTERGTSYAGKVSRTASGKSCQRWDSQTPNRHQYTNVDRFPDASLQEAGNYCRNPGDNALGPWCYTSSGSMAWEYCDIPICHCKTTRAGTDYTGNIRKTVSGRSCQPWSSQSPHQHDYTSASFPNDQLGEVRNYCRNPNGQHPGGPWCLTQDPDVRWEYCEVPYCDCKLGSGGLEYNGKRGLTRSGHTCQRWDQQAPHQHNYNDATLFPEDSVTAAENYCRTPDKTEEGGPWCYTMNDQVRWEYCDILPCELPHVQVIEKTTTSLPPPTGSPYDCLRDSLGVSYTGRVSVTVSGKTCQTWTSQSPHRHGYTDPAMYPDDTVADAGNACRNIDNEAGGPWCYTTDPDSRWEYCSQIPACPGQTVPSTKAPKSVDAVVYECKRSERGEEYRGRQTLTASGRTCEKWSEFQHDFTDLTFPDASMREAANFCRNPAANRDAPWCFTSETEWEYCSIPDCGCKKEKHGRNYTGSMKTTASGKKCQAWSSRQPQNHNYNEDDSLFSDGSVSAAGSFCRNPDPSEESGPWCFTTDPSVRWEYCDVPACDCLLSPKGLDYVGPRSVTEIGLRCQPWSSQSPQRHGFTDSGAFPDDTLEEAANYCRNPTGDEDAERPWCYTTDPSVRWAYCDVPLCYPPPPLSTDQAAVVVNGTPKECLQSTSGLEYMGTQSTTRNGHTCQSWSTQTPHRHQYTTSSDFADKTMGQVKNYCRNPDDNETGGVWCYTTDANVRWEFCDVALCDGVTAPTSTTSSTSVPTSASSTVPSETPGSEAESERPQTQRPTTQSSLPQSPIRSDGVRECRSNVLGAAYKGTNSVTRSGRQCQRWDKQMPHPHDHTDATVFPDTSIQDAGNFCRNPGKWQPSGPWCFTEDPNIQWEYCDILFCECKSTAGGHEYGGRMSTTRSGLACQRWDAQFPHRHRNFDNKYFPDASVSAAENFCRNPEASVNGGPWCYTTDPSKLWEYCDVPLCDGVVIEEGSDAAASVEEIRDPSLTAGSLAAIVLGSLLMLVLIFLVVMFIRYRTHLPGAKATANTNDPTKELGLTFYGNKTNTQQRVLYIDRPRQEVNEACLTRMPTNEYMTLPPETNSDVYEIPVTAM